MYFWACLRSNKNLLTGSQKVTQCSQKVTQGYLWFRSSITWMWNNMPCIQGEAKELGETNTRLPTMVYSSHSSKETCNALPALVTVAMTMLMTTHTQKSNIW